MQNSLSVFTRNYIDAWVKYGISLNNWALRTPRMAFHVFSLFPEFFFLTTDKTTDNPRITMTTINDTKVLMG